MTLVMHMPHLRVDDLKPWRMGEPREHHGLEYLAEPGSSLLLVDFHHEDPRFGLDPALPEIYSLE